MKERGKERGAEGLTFFTVLYAGPESAKLKHDKKPLICTCILFRCCCVEVPYYVSYVIRQ